jgi:hypothetical protein
MAAPALPSVPDLGGLSQLNSAPDLEGSLESTAHQTGELAGSSVGQAASNGLPTERLGGLPALSGATQSPLSVVTGTAPGLSALRVGSLPVDGLPHLRS